VICYLNDAGLITTSYKTYFFEDLLFYDRNLMDIFVYVQQVSGFYSIIVRFSINNSAKFIFCYQA
jgi:hypothetical protein